MSAWVRLARWALVLVGLSAGSGAALADGLLPLLPALAPLPPVLVVGSTDIDPAKYDWLSDGGRKALTNSIAQLKSGALAASVFAAAPGGDFWSYHSASKASEPYTIADLAKQALQSCQIYGHTLCFIVSINGKEARDGQGNMPDQPDQLAGQPAEFDANRVPFVSQTDRRLIQAYAAETKAKVLVVTASGGWLWRTGDTLFAAVATGDADCKKNYPNDICILYALNSRVVFDPNAPN